MEKDSKLKMALISGASHAIKFKELNPEASEQEVLKHITREADDILEKIDNEF